MHGKQLKRKLQKKAGKTGASHSWLRIGEREAGGRRDSLPTPTTTLGPHLLFKWACCILSVYLFICIKTTCASGEPKGGGRAGRQAGVQRFTSEQQACLIDSGLPFTLVRLIRYLPQHMCASFS